jgi:hypothetical protein
MRLKETIAPLLKKLPFGSSEPPQTSFSPQGSSTAVFKILTDYDSYFEWLPFVTRSRLLANEGTDLAIAEFEVRDPYEKLIVECIHNKNRSVILRKISGDVPFDQFWWTIECEEESCEVSLDATPGRSWRDRIHRRPDYWNAADVLQALQAYEAFRAGDPSEQPIQKILELRQSDTGLILWAFGREYRLDPVGKENHDKDRT